MQGAIADRKRTVLIFSGGLDSTTLLNDIHDQGFDVHALTFDYHQKHRKEIDCAKNICPALISRTKSSTFPS